MAADVGKCRTSSWLRHSSFLRAAFFSSSSTPTTSSLVYVKPRNVELWEELASKEVLSTSSSTTTTTTTTITVDTLRTQRVTPKGIAIQPVYHNLQQPQQQHSSSSNDHDRVVLVNSHKCQGSNHTHVAPTLPCTLHVHGQYDNMQAFLPLKNQIYFTKPSFVVNALICLLFLWLIFGKFNMIYQQIVRQLPPGYIGWPIIRDIQFLLTLTREGGLMTALKAGRQRYGKFFTAPFIGGGVNVTCGGQDDLLWLFNNDAKSATDTAWPRNISALLGPGAVANQVGIYHRALRQLLEPSFAPKFVNNYLTVMDETTLEELDDWCTTGDYVSSNVFKMYALKLFYKSAFGRTDEMVLAKLHDDFKLWLGGFLSLTGARRIPGSVIDTAMKARERIFNKDDG